MIFEDTDRELNYVLHEHIVGDKQEYQLSIEDNLGELQYIVFHKAQMATISDNPNITRLFGTLSEDTRSEGWLSFNGETVEPERDNLPGIYNIVDNGKMKIGIQTEKYSEVFFNGTNLSDRWILRKMPNVFDKAMFSEESILLLWKPTKQKSYENAHLPTKPYNTKMYSCATNEISAKFSEITKDGGIDIISKLTSDVIFDTATNTFEGVASAEGTWIDMFGEKYTYTPEFIIHDYNNQRDTLKRGEKILVGTDHKLDSESFNGEITDVQLFQEPIYHIRVKGIYNGPADIKNEKYGLSYEYRFSSSWNEEFQSWVPFKSKTNRIDVVKRPACKICWINKVNEK